MEISMNWTKEERRVVALDLAIQARNKTAYYIIAEPDRQFAWECLESITYLLSNSISSEWFEANRTMILAHYRG